jgi:hypothetical protein
MAVVKDVRPREGYRLDVTFSDGSTRTVDLSSRVMHGRIFEPLRDPEFFARVYVDHNLGTVVWPNGADLDPDWLAGEESEGAHNSVQLSAREQAILTYIRSFTQANHYAPTLRELAVGVGASSSHSLNRDLSRLEARGLIRREPGKPRSIRLASVA